MSSRGTDSTPSHPKSTPMPRPTSAPVTDRHSASSASSRFIWRLVRPSARSSPFSRVRSTTDRDRVLATPTRETMTDTPSRAMTAMRTWSMTRMYVWRSRALPSTLRDGSSVSRALCTSCASAPSESFAMTRTRERSGAIAARFEAETMTWSGSALSL